MNRMKQRAALLLALLVLGLSGCREEPAPSTPDVLVPAVMYNGEIYCSTGRQLAGEVAPEAIVGEITSTVPLSQWPTEEGQANFDGLGHPYAVTSDGLLVTVDNEWTLFELRDVEDQPQA